MKRLICGMAAVALLVGCRHAEMPSDVMTHEQMVGYLSEAYLLEGYYAIENNFSYESVSPEVLAAYDELLKERGLTREKVERSIAYYSANPEEYQQIHEEVVALLEEENEEVNDVVAADTVIKIKMQPMLYSR